MKTMKLYAILLAVTLVAGVSIFYACQKNEILDIPQKSTKTTETVIEYMDIPCVDFSQIKKEVNAKGETMLKFDSWEHYAKVIDALLDFSYKYTDARVKETLEKNGKIGDDTLSEILQEQGFYQFMPLYSVCRQLKFDNNAFEKLRKEEIEWMQNPEASHIRNPFDEMELGYIQSALHNTNGDVMIGDEMFNPKVALKNDAKVCEIGGADEEWFQYSHDAKKRELRAFIKSFNKYSYTKTSVYYFNSLNNRIVWLCNVGASVYGNRLLKCDDLTGGKISFSGGYTVYASVVERYVYYSSAPSTYLKQDYSLVFSSHAAPGKVEELVIY